MILPWPPSARAVAVAALVLVAGAAVAVAWYEHQRAADAAREAQRVADSAKLAKDGATVAKPASAAEMAALVDNAVREQLAKIRRDIPDAHVAASGHASTGTLPVIASPSPPLLPAAGEGGTARNPSSPSPCALFTTDTVTLTCDGQRIETSAGARALIGLARAIRGSDGAVLAEGPFKSDLTQYLTDKAAEPVKPSWAAGPVAGLSRERWVIGAQVLSPPLRVFGLHVRASATVAAGNGERVGLVGVVVGR